MNLPELIESLAVAGLKPTLGPEGSVDIVGPTERLTDELRQGICDNKPELITTLACFAAHAEPEKHTTPSEPTATEKVGDDFIEMAAEDHLNWIDHQIEKQDTPEDFDAFEQRFENDLERHEVYRPIAGDVRELIRIKRCEDQCARVHNKDRWVQRIRNGRPFYECGECGRFVGYVVPEPKSKKKGKRSKVSQSEILPYDEEANGPDASTSEPF